MPMVSSKYTDQTGRSQPITGRSLFSSNPRTGEPPAEMLRWLNNEISGKWGRVFGSPYYIPEILVEAVDMLSGEQINYCKIHQNSAMQRDGIEKQDMPPLKYYEIIWFEKEQDAIFFKLVWM